MNKQEVLYGAIGLLTGIVLTLVVGTVSYSANHDGAGMMTMMRQMYGWNDVGGVTCSLENCDH